MADRLGQEKDNKRSKTLLTVAVVLVVLNVLLFFLVPTQKTVSYDEDAVIYSVSDEQDVYKRQVSRSLSLSR